MKAVVILARHGGTSWNNERRLQGRTDISLSPEGVNQVTLLSRALSSTPISNIYCSPLSRSKRTAEIISAPHGLTPHVKESFIEMSFGRWEGKTTSYLSANYPDDFKNWLRHPTRVRIPEAENLQDVQRRAFNGFMQVIEENHDKVVAIVGHGGVNRVLLLSMLDSDLEAFWRIRQDNACLNLIEMSESTCRVSLVNSTAHLMTDYAALVRQAKSRI